MRENGNKEKLKKLPQSEIDIFYQITKILNFEYVAEKSRSLPSL